MANDINQLVTNPELIGLERQRQMAQALLKQGMQTPQGQMVGDRYVPVNPMQFVGNLFQQYSGNKGLENLDQQELALAKALREKKLAETTDIMKSLTGTPEVATELAGPAYNGVSPTAVMPAVQASPQEALAKALKSETGAGNMLLPSIIENVIPKKTQEIINYETAKKDGFKGTFNDYKNQMNEYQKAELGIQKQRLALEGANANKGQVVETPQGVVLVNPRNGQVTPLSANGQPLMGKNNQTESQAKASVYHNQMVSASNELNAIQGAGFNPNNPASQAKVNIAGGMFNAVTPADAQQFKQAQNQWTEAYLRFKTGAGTNAHEVEENRKTYFPQLGDKPEAIAQKARMRQQAESDIAMATGRAVAPALTQANPVANAPAIPSANPQVTPQATPNAWGQAVVVGK